MRELAVQSSNDTNTDGDRAEIQKEVNQLNDEIDRISNTTQFNTKNLLDGSMGAGVTTSVANVNTNKSIAVGSGATAVASGSLLTALADKSGNSVGIATGDIINISYVKDGATISSSYTVTATSAMSDLVAQMGGSGADAYGGVASGMTITAVASGFAGAVNGLTLSVKSSGGTTRASATNALSSFTETTQAANSRADGQATLQIGANTSQNMQVSIENMGTAALGVKGLKVGNQGQANVAITVIDNATQKVSAERSKLGAVQNRLEHTINNLGTSSENMTSAESRIRDVDMAKEMMMFTKNNILSQAAQSMLAQANQQPQGVLQLLQ